MQHSDTLLSQIGEDATLQSGISFSKKPKVWARTKQKILFGTSRPTGITRGCLPAARKSGNRWGHRITASPKPSLQRHGIVLNAMLGSAREISSLIRSNRKRLKTHEQAG